MIVVVLWGMELFFSEQVKCSQCYGGFDFMDYCFVNNGLYVDYVDFGCFCFIFNEVDWVMFKVFGLCNVVFIVFYMYDGFIVILEGVIVYYNSGGQEYFNKSELIRLLGL